MCTLGLTNDLIDGGQLRAKPRLRKAKPNHVYKTVFIPRLAAVYQVVDYSNSIRRITLLAEPPSLSPAERLCKQGSIR